MAYQKSGWAMRKKTNGYVLLVVLVYLQLFGLLILSALSNRGKLQKQIQAKQWHFRQRHEARVLLAQLDRMYQSSCLRPVSSTAYMLHQPFSFWQAFACRGGDGWAEYYYFWQDIGIDRCHRMNEGDGMGLSVRYIRLTLVYAGAAVIVQDTYAYPTQLALDCHEDIKEVSPGRVALRWLR